MKKLEEKIKNEDDHGKLMTYFYEIHNISNDQTPDETYDLFIEWNKKIDFQKFIEAFEVSHKDVKLGKERTDIRWVMAGFPIMYKNGL